MEGRRASFLTVILILSSVSCFSVITLPENVTATTLFVGGGGFGNYTTIQDGIDAAGDGDIVYVYKGVYVEGLKINKIISLIGESKSTTVINGEGEPNVIRVTEDWVNISGFTIINGDHGINLGVSSYCNVSNNIITGNTWGMYLASTTNEFSGNNTITSNDVSSNDWVGIYVRESSNNTISNNTASNNHNYGIHITWHSNSNTILNNTASYNGLAGIRTYYSINNTIANNVMVENGIFVWGVFLEHFNTHTIDTSNTVNGKPVYYWKNAIGGKIPLGAGEVILANCTDVTVENQIMSKSTVGVLLAFSTKNNIVNNTASQDDGITLYYSNNNTVKNNTLSYNEFGIILGHANNNSISNNTVYLSHYRGIHLYISDSNTVYHNNFIDNVEQAYDNTDSNQWDNGYPSGGNYWSDYTGMDECSGPNQDVCPDSDGVGDTPYVIDPDSRDRYPLMSPPFPLPPLPPSEPQNLQATADDRRIALTWEAPALDGGSPVASYVVYRGTSSSGETYLVTVGNVLTYIDTGLTNGQTYFYQVSAMNGAWEGPKSDEANATPATVPGVPRELTAEGGNKHVVLNWLAPTDDGGSLITDYRIYRGTTPNGETFLNDIGDVLTYVDTGLANGQTYYYRVFALNAVGEGPGSNEANATPTNQPPTCIIITPTEGETVSGTYAITGTAADSDGVVLEVEIRIDDGDWIDVTGTTSWSYDWDTPNLPKGQHSVWARSYDGTNYSNEVNVTINVDSTPSDEPGGDVFWILVALILVITAVILLILLILVLRKRKREEDRRQDTSQEEDSGNRF